MTFRLKDNWLSTLRIIYTQAQGIMQTSRVFGMLCRRQGKWRL